MDEMKYDMCGAASVLGTLTAVAEAKLPVNDRRHCRRREYALGSGHAPQGHRQNPERANGET